MSFEQFIARRYLLTPRRHRSISVITKLSVAGVALGVMTLIVVLSVMNGFEKDLKGALQGANGHLSLYGYGQGFRWDPNSPTFDVLKQHEEVRAISPFTQNQALIMGRNKPMGAMIKGIDPKTEGQVSQILFSIRTKLFDAEGDKRDNSQSQELSQEDQAQAHAILEQLKPHLVELTLENGEQRQQRVSGILLGSQLAKKLGVSIGDFVTLVSPEERITPMGGIPRAKRFYVIGYVESGIMGYDEVLAYIDLEQAQKIYRMEDRVSGLTIRLSSVELAEEVKNELKRTYTFPYDITSWEDENVNLFKMFELEKMGLAIVLTLIILIAAFNIISSLIMLVTEKKKDIAILKAMGAKHSAILSIFVRQGAVIGLIGTVIGEILGLLLCYVIASFDVLDIPPGVYVGNRIPVHVEWWQVILIALVSLVICLSVTLLPSRQAANLDPVEGLRNE